ncbi:hypothetical protein [Bacillus sp. AFS041924]|uniref:hypothetical protein n=1 Tax=Bacillus sp. AFS041924 TaxID=2033503 RepID=UPI000BFC6F1E|nr:hypothetical protein [Bacillus sp. AFS041924]PGS48966.1 hypothetical protein COC46_15825 [Bacillus sp. AFS041924]
MIIQECLRYYKSKLLIILTFGLTLILLSSYYSTKEWEQVFQSKAVDVNLDKVAEIISSYTGTYYLNSFFYSSCFIVFVLIILIFGSINYLRSDSLGNNLFKFTFTQLLFLSSYLISYFLIVFILSVLLIN